MKRLFLAVAAFAAAHAAAMEPFLAPAPWRDPSAPQDAATALAVPKAVASVPAIDTASRAAVRSAYNAYWNLPMPAMGFTGSIAGCNAGTISLAFQEWTISRINFLRAMAGVPGNTVLDSTKDAQEQAASLIMAANNVLTHAPSAGMTCYTALGAVGAGESNLALGVDDSIPLYMSEPGFGNEAVGHRRWILHTRKTRFGHGQAGSASALSVFEQGTTAATPNGIPWPPRGYVPLDIFPSLYIGAQRWSFGMPGAGFGAAGVSVALNGSPVPVTVISRTANGYGDNTIVWEMPNGHVVAKDTVYDVTVSGVSGAASSIYQYQVRPFDPEEPIGIARSDFNADGRSDILWRHEGNGQVYRMLMNGGTIAAAAMVYAEPNTAWRIAAEGDFNGDGTTDLLWRNAVSGQVSMLLFGAGGVPAGAYAIYTEANPAWRIVHAPDLDGDGRSDILWWNSTTGQVHALLMNGPAIVGAGPVYTEPNTNWRIAATGDFAGSGRQNQLLWRHQLTGQVFLQTVNRSGGGFTQSGRMIYHEPNTAWKILGAPDLNGDGRSDILWRNDATGRVFGLLMSNASIVGSGVIHHEPNLAWKIVAHGDYDGDGRSDLLWRNDSTGVVYLMTMNGIAVTGAGPIYQEPNAAWRILGPPEYGE